MFASSVKPGAVHAPLGLIGEAHAVTGLPVVAIGGITLDNAPQLVAAGAAALAVISALFEAADITATARSFTALFAGRPQP
jgi:thiamine-phosphate pyrophosphorylase